MEFNIENFQFTVLYVKPFGFDKLSLYLCVCILLARKLVGKKSNHNNYTRTLCWGKANTTSITLCRKINRILNASALRNFVSLKKPSAEIHKFFEQLSATSL